MQNKRREQKVHEFNFKKAQADIDKVCARGVCCP